MKTNMTLRTLVLAASLVGATGLAAARSSSMVELGRQSLAGADGKPLSVEVVRKAIITGGAAHHWATVSDKPGVLTPEADSGAHQAVVDVAYDALG